VKHFPLKIFSFWTKFNLRREFQFRQLRSNLVFGDFYDVLLIRRLPHHHLISHYSQTPNIYLLVIRSLFQLLRTNVSQTTNDRISQTLRVNRTPEVSDFGITLNYHIFTLFKKTFSGFISRWIISYACIYLSPSHICRIYEEV
jgi:hypothetical protein